MDIVERLRKPDVSPLVPLGCVTELAEEAATEIERLRRQPMDAIEQLSGSFGDGELAAEVKRLEAKCAEQRALIDRWNACNAREVEAMNKAGQLVAEMRERCTRRDTEIERLRAELAAEREAVRVLSEECACSRDAWNNDMLRAKEQIEQKYRVKL